MVTAAVRDVTRAHRLDLIDTLEGLGPDQWQAPSLCTSGGWSTSPPTSPGHQSWAWVPARRRWSGTGCR